MLVASAVAPFSSTTRNSRPCSNASMDGVRMS